MNPSQFLIAIFAAIGVVSGLITIYQFISTQKKSKFPIIITVIAIVIVAILVMNISSNSPNTNPGFSPTVSNTLPAIADSSTPVKTLNSFLGTWKQTGSKKTAASLYGTDNYQQNLPGGLTPNAWAIPPSYNSSSPAKIQATLCDYISGGGQIILPDGTLGEGTSTMQNLVTFTLIAENLNTWKIDQEQYDGNISVSGQSC